MGHRSLLGAEGAFPFAGAQGPTKRVDRAPAWKEGTGLEEATRHACHEVAFRAVTGQLQGWLK